MNDVFIIDKNNHILCTYFLYKIWTDYINKNTFYSEIVNSKKFLITQWRRNTLTIFQLIHEKSLLFSKTINYLYQEIQFFSFLFGHLFVIWDFLQSNGMQKTLISSNSNISMERLHIGFIPTLNTKNMSCTNYWLLSISYWYRTRVARRDYNYQLVYKKQLLNWKVS